MSATRTEELLRTAQRVLAPTYAPFPMVADRGAGVQLWDADGRRYLDFTGGVGVNALGHAHPEVVAAVQEQVGRLAHTSNAFVSAPPITLCARLAELSFADQAFLTNSGAEATEAALKLCRRHFHRRGDPRARFVATSGSFHGRTLGALSVTGQPSYREGYEPMVPGVTFVPFGDAAALRAALDETVAAVILEPIQGNSGVVVPPDGYLREARAACDEAGCWLVLDEIQTGLGRTGRWFAHEHEDVVPDVMTLAKTLGGGLPLGAMVTTQAHAAAFTVNSHGTTFGGNPVACAAGLATLRVFERDGLIARAEELGGRLRRALAGAFPEVRGKGLMVGIVTDQPAKAVRERCFARGLLVTTAGANVVRLLPPLVVGEAEIDEAVEILKGI